MEIDEPTKLKLYTLIFKRYKSLIAEKESKNITEIRQRCSPYNDFIKKLSSKITDGINIYNYQMHFLAAVEKSLEYIRGIKTIELEINFWLSFDEIDEIKAASIFDKSLILCALLRSLGSENVNVAITEHKKNYVRFSYNNENYAIISESGSLLAGDDVAKLLGQDRMSYSFSDLMFESYD